MELPKELRLIIYEYVFHDILGGISTPRFLRTTSRKRRLDEGEDPKAAMKDRLKRLLALVHTSHNFHAEGIGIGKKLVAALMSSIYAGHDGAWFRRPGEVGEHVITATIDAKRRLRELKDMNTLLFTRRW
jgi:hypothetical protein